MTNYRLSPTAWLLSLFIISACVFIGCEEDDDLLAGPSDEKLSILNVTINDDAVTSGTTGIPVSSLIKVYASHVLNPETAANSFSFTGGSAPDFELSFENSSSAWVITLNTQLAFETSYTVSINSGILGAREQELDEPFSFSFTTGPFVPPGVSIAASSTSVAEGGGTSNITATLEFTTTENVSVTLGTSGTAASADYTITPMTIDIPAGSSSGTAQLVATQDGELEGPETAIISIANAANAVSDGNDVTITIIDDDKDSNGDGSPDQGLIINEVLFDPASDLTGDANGDGTRSASEDEFIEFYNDSDEFIDLSDYTLHDIQGGDTPRHVFPNPTVIPPGGTYLLFGGGTPTGSFGCAQVATTTTGVMQLTNGGDIITIKDPSGAEFFKWDTAVEGLGLNYGANVSITRSPDINGAYMLHTDVNSSLFTAGTMVSGGCPTPILADGTGFIVNEVLYDPPGAVAGEPNGDANGDGTRSASQDEFIEFLNDTDQPVDLSGFTLFDNARLGGVPRHTFPANSIVPPRTAYVLFGGGTPTGSFGRAIVGTTTEGSMNLTNGGDAFTILDTNGALFMFWDSTVEAAGLNLGDNQSATRSPDITGAYVLHSTIGGEFSPGVQADGSPFYSN